MKITKRIAEEQYCFTELEFDNLEEYKKEYPEFIKYYYLVKKEIKKVKKNLPPFED